MGFLTALVIAWVAWGNWPFAPSDPMNTPVTMENLSRAWPAVLDHRVAELVKYGICSTAEDCTSEMVRRFPKLASDPVLLEEIPRSLERYRRTYLLEAMRRSQEDPIAEVIIECMIVPLFGGVANVVQTTLAGLDNGFFNVTPTTTTATATAEPVAKVAESAPQQQQAAADVVIQAQ
jgi:hypothetical protein